MTDEPAGNESGFLNAVGRFFVDVGKGLLDDLGLSFRWALWGAMIGAVLLGGTGFWYFGWEGLGLGLLAGAVLGGVGAWLLYLFALAA